MTRPDPLTREGCCNDQRKPCTYHEGVQDTVDAVKAVLDSGGQMLDVARRAVATRTWTTTQLVVVKVDEFLRYLAGDK